MAEPYDSIPYDPLAEAIGWYIRACSKVELWLDICAADIFSVPYVEAIRLKVERKARALHDVDPDLGALVERLLYLFEIRNTLAHGIANYIYDRTAIHLELQPSKKGASYRKVRLTRAELVALGDEVRGIAGQMQVEMVAQMGEIFDVGDDEEVGVTDPVARAEWEKGWITDPSVLSEFPTLSTPGRIYSMHRDENGDYWGVFWDQWSGSPRKVRRLREDQP